MPAIRIKAQSSVPSITDIARWTAKHFRLKGVQAELCADGVNLTYRLSSAQGPRILRVYRPGRRSDAQIAFELRQLRFLKAAGLPVSAALPDAQGHLSSVLRVPDGPTRAALFSLAPGAVRTQPVRRVGRLVGTQLAALHTLQSRFALKPDLLPLDERELIKAPLEQLRPYKGGFGKDWAWLLRAAAKLARALGRLPRGPQAFGLIHGDPHSWNMSYDTRARRFTFFDFDHSTRGWYLFDLATFVWGSGWPDDQRILGTKALLEAYGAKRPLSEAERQGLPDMVAARHLWWMGFQASQAELRGTEAVSPWVHQQKLGTLKRWASGKLAKSLGF